MVDKQNSALGLLVIGPTMSYRNLCFFRLRELNFDWHCEIGGDQSNHMRTKTCCKMLQVFFHFVTVRCYQYENVPCNRCSSVIDIVPCFHRQSEVK